MLIVSLVLLLVAKSANADPGPSAAPWVERAREYLVQHLAAAAGPALRVEATAVGQMESVRLPAGSVLQPRMTGDVHPSKRMCVWVDVAVQGRRVQSIPVWFAVTAYRPVALTTRALGVHESIAAGDVRFEERDIAGIGGKPLTPGHDFAAQRTRRPVGMGQIVTEVDVEARPMVIRQQEIDVRVTAGSVVIETKGIAMAEGNVGQRILVRNPLSQESYYAKVVADGRVVAAP
jgi:flagella basal body P-ring formation protein FlgA